VKRRITADDAASTLPAKQRRRIVRAAQIGFRPIPTLPARYGVRRGAHRALGLATLYANAFPV